MSEDRELRPPVIGVGTMNISPRARALVNEVLDSNRLSYGPMTQAFEDGFARAHGCRFGVMSNSGTSALLVALAALKELHGWDDGDEVILPAVTFAGTANIVFHARMRPVLVDVDPIHYELDPERIEAAVTDRTRAVIPVHVFGQPCDMDPVLELAGMVLSQGHRRLGGDHVRDVQRSQRWQSRRNRVFFHLRGAPADDRSGRTEYDRQSRLCRKAEIADQPRTGFDVSEHRRRRPEIAGGTSKNRLPAIFFRESRIQFPADRDGGRARTGAAGGLAGDDRPQEEECRKSDPQVVRARSVSAASPDSTGMRTLLHDVSRSS